MVILTARFAYCWHGPPVDVIYFFCRTTSGLTLCPPVCTSPWKGFNYAIPSHGIRSPYLLVLSINQNEQPDDTSHLD